MHPFLCHMISAAFARCHILHADSWLSPHHNDPLRLFFMHDKTQAYVSSVLCAGVQIGNRRLSGFHAEYYEAGFRLSEVGACISETFYASCAAKISYNIGKHCGLLSLLIYK